MAYDTHKLDSAPSATPTSKSLPSHLSFLSPLERVFLVQETVGMIMDELSPQALLHMGLSCRALYEPAMDRLWRTLPSLGTLFLCLPEGLVETVTCRQLAHTPLRIKRVPEPHQWERIRHYAHRVKIFISPIRDVTATSLHLIKSHYPEPVLFPNLRECSLLRDTGSREFDLLLQPSLLALRYDIKPLKPGSWHLDRIAKNAPNLQVLHLADRTRCNANEGPSVFRNPETCQALSDSILCFWNLVVVNFATFFHLKAILHLSMMPRLARLHVYLGDDNCSPLCSRQQDHVPFLSLSTFHISGKNLHQLTSWLQPLQLPSLTTIRVSSRMSTSIPSIEKFFHVLTRFEGLTSLELLFFNRGCFTDDSILNPLLQRLPCLEQFIITGLPFNPTRDSLASMASAWPRLRNLELGQSCYLEWSSRRVSTRDLLIIAYYCPTIERIAIPLLPHMAINPTCREDGVVVVTKVNPPIPPSQNPLLGPIFPNPTTSTVPRIPVSKLRDLRITGNFIPADYQRIAEFLANVFPHAKLSFRCPRRYKSSLENCVERIMGLKREVLSTL